MKKYNKTAFLMSTPCYDEKVGAAANHIYDGQVHERTYEETKGLLEKHFTIVEHFGTFASIKDYKEEMSESQKEIFEDLRKYYDVNLISVIMAPLFPAHSRNVMWKLKLKK